MSSNISLSGIINTSQTFTAGTTVKLVGNAQVAQGVSLTFEAGSNFDLSGFKILNYGTVNISGTADEFANLKNGTYSTENATGVLNSYFARISNVTIDGFFSNGILTLEQSVISKSTVEALDQNSISDSIFIDTKLDIGIEGVTVFRTTFLESLVEVLAWNSTFGGISVFEQCNFVNTGTAIYLNPFFSGDDYTHKISIANSYINSSDADSKIYDADDDLRVVTNIYQSSFTESPYLNGENGVSVGETYLTKADLGVKVALPASSRHLLSIIVDESVLGSPIILHDLNESITMVDGVKTVHTITYEGTHYDYAEIDHLITTVVRDGEFTEEFASELNELSYAAGALTYNDIVTLVGVPNLDDVLLHIAGADGNYIS